MTLTKNVVLCGFMGSGKSTLGIRLARKLDADFVDMDKYIEQQQQTAIAELFRLYGEAGFRDIEHEAALELSQRRGTVIASGGGALLYKRNSDALKQNGIVMLLDCGFELCYRRIADSDRPIVRASTESELKKLYYRRMKIYRSVADIRLNTGLSRSKSCERAIKLLGLTPDFQ